MVADVWDDSAAYEAYVGRWSRLVAAAFLRWLPHAPHRTWLDFGCGTGALTQQILAATQPRRVVGCDRSAAYTAFARAHIPDERATFVTSELSNLPETEGGFDAIVAGLVLNFLPVPLDALRTLTGRASHGGLVGAYVWDYAEGMQMMRIFWDAAGTLDPAAQALDEGVRFPLCRPDRLHALFERSGLHQVQVQPIEIPTVFVDFDDYWTPFLGGQGPAPGYTVSLPPEERERLSELTRLRLPVRQDGRIALTARVWAAQGIAV